MKFRHEYKHNINYIDYLALRSRLLAVARPDGNACADGTYLIRSLYFDNLSDKVLREKIDGVNNREKFRIRFYNRDDTVIHLEKKSKINGLCNKLSTNLTREQTENIIAGRIDFMKESKDALLIEFYAKMKYQLLRPKTIVDYIREPYIYGPGNVRITIDSQIRTGILSKSIFTDILPTINTGYGNAIILEVKYDEFLPEVINMILQLQDRRTTAFSKYAAARIYG